MQKKYCTVHVPFSSGKTNGSHLPLFSLTYPKWVGALQIEVTVDWLPVNYCDFHNSAEFHLQGLSAELRFGFQQSNVRR